MSPNSKLYGAEFLCDFITFQAILGMPFQKRLVFCLYSTEFILSERSAVAACSLRRAVLKDGS